MTADLAGGLRLHQSGRLVEAARVYSAVLAREPDHPDALHLMGVVAHQQGRPAQAVEYINKALARSPQSAPYHANLAEALRALGQLDKAVRAGQTAVRLQPTFPEAHNNLSLALRALGRGEEGLHHAREAVRLRPDFALAHNNLGDLLRERGQFDEALACFRRAVACDPACAEARSNLGQLLVERQQIAEALEHCLEAVRLRPQLAEAHNNLGNALREQGNPAEARLSYERALTLNPELGLTYANLGRTHQEQGNYAEARRWYDQALQRDPTSGRLHFHLGSLAEAQEQPAEAERHYRNALQFEPGAAGTYNALGHVLHELGRDAEAEPCYREALRLNPNLVPAHVNMGDMLEELGRFDEAEASFRAALRLNPTHGGALGQLATMLRGKLPDDDVQRMRALAERPEQLGTRRVNLWHGLAHALDARDEYAEAARLLVLGNAARKQEWERQGKGYDPAAHSQLVDRLIDTFTPEFFERTRGFGLSTRVPVFVLGLPRSATTLTEQIIASHSQAFGAGELRLGRDGFESLPQLAGTGSTFDALAHLDQPLTRRAAQRHLDALRLLSETADRVVDKMPDNYLYMGWLAVLFPKARFVHTRRDLRDIAVSCWMTNFKSIRWACDPAHIAARFADYTRLMEHWRKVLPMLEIDYEDTVANLEATARKLLDWVGLEWEDGCLAFHQSKRPIRTASVSQVRQPIYTRAVARWRHYERDLGELFARLPAPPAPADRPT